MYGLDKPGDHLWSLDYVLVKPNEETFYEGRVITQYCAELNVGEHTITLVTILKGLHEDQLRLAHPQRYQLPTDRQVEIATTEEVRLWLSTTNLDFLDAIMALSTVRKARLGYDRSKFLYLSSTDY